MGVAERPLVSAPPTDSNSRKALQRKRGEIIERTFAHICETGGARRTAIERAGESKQALPATVLASPGFVMRYLLGRGTPRGLGETLRCTAQVIARFTSFLETLIP